MSVTFFAYPFYFLGVWQNVSLYYQDMVMESILLITNSYLEVPLMELGDGCAAGQNFGFVQKSILGNMMWTLV